MVNNTSILKLLFVGLLASSCNSFLDETPDNRTSVDSQDKIQKLLVDAYPSTVPVVVAELSSDNIVDQGDNAVEGSRVYGQLAYWQDVTETNNDGIENVWQSCFNAVAHSNLALESIEKLEASTGRRYNSERGEALITRAYSYFLLANIFCREYSPANANELGLPYLDKPEKKLNVKYEDRGTLKELYERINSDIEAALPLLEGVIYKVPQYHFTPKAAYAFAARFNLFYGNWDKAKEYATRALGVTPVLRDWTAFRSLPQFSNRSNMYIDDPSNFLEIAFTSNAAPLFGASRFGYRYAHTQRWSRFTINAPTPWATSGVTNNQTKLDPISLISPFNKVIVEKLPFLFQITNPVAQTGFRKTVVVAFSAEETLLVRAEAKVMLKEYESAVEDLNMWSRNIFNDNATVTVDSVKSFFDSIAYASDTQQTIKEHLTPAFPIEEGTQESLVHYILQCRRVLTLHEGLRWFDIKRYGIEVRRWQVASDNVTEVLKAKLPVGDPRRAVQIPSDVRAAGFPPNPR